MTAAKPTSVDHKLPDGWRQVRLGDVAEIRKGQSFTSRDLVPGDVPVIAGGMSPAYFHVTSNRPPETVTVSASGAHAGFVAFHKRPIFATDCSTVQNKENEAVINFVFHFLKNAQDAIYYRRRGSAQPHVYPEDIASLHILLPPLPEQRAIAAVLDSIDDAIEGAEAVIAATESLRDALLHDLLTRGLPRQHTEFRDVPGLGTIPADWDMVRLGDVVPKFEYVTSTKCSSEPAGMPILRIPNIASGSLNLSDLKYAHLGPKESTSIQLATGDILLVRTNGNPDICGQCWVSEGLEGNWGFASYLVRGRADISRMNPWFVGHFLRSGVGRRLLKGNIRTSAGNYNLSVASLGSMLLPCPPLNEQDLIIGTIRGLTRSIELAGQETTGLRLLKDSTAAALLTGNLRTQALSM